MTLRHTIFYVLALPLLTSCIFDNTRTDFDNICEGLTHAFIHEKDPNERVKMRREWMQKKMMTDAGKSMAKVVYDVPPEKQYDNIKKAAKDAGYDDWTCTKLKNAFDPSNKLNSAESHFQKQLKSYLEVRSKNAELEDESQHKRFVLDSENHHIKMWGDTGPCGCPESETLSAFRTSENQELWVQHNYNGCEFAHKLSSNRDFKSLMPKNLLTGLGKAKKEWQNTPTFYVEPKLPQHGEDIVLDLKVIPIGMKDKTCNTFICLNVSQEGGSLKSIEWLRNRSLLTSKSGEIESWAEMDGQELEDKFTELKNKHGLNVATALEFRDGLQEAVELFKRYESYKFYRIILRWDPAKENFRVFTHAKRKKKKDMNLQRFLKKTEYWGPRC